PPPDFLGLEHKRRGNKALVKRCGRIFMLAVICVYLAGCASSGRASRNAGESGSITALGTWDGRGIDPSAPMFAGDGGSGIHLAVLAPETHGIVPAFLPLHIQGLLNNIFNRYSNIGLIDRQNLDRIIFEQDLAAGGRFSDQDFITIGNLTNTQYFLFGTIQNIAWGRYSLQLSITEAATGVIRASFMAEGSFAQFQGRADIINSAALALLTQMGVELTEPGRQSLMAGNSQIARAQAEMARGIAAMRAGDELQALFNMTQAAAFDPTNLEVLTQLNTLSADISGGTISQMILNDILARDRWLEVFRETALFFNENPPFELIFDPALFQVGEPNFARRTATLGMRMSVDASYAGFNALNALVEGLEETGRRDAWGFAGWPLMNITPRDRSAIVFNGNRSFRFRVDVELINEYGRTIGRDRVTFNTEQIGFNSGDASLTPPGSVEETAIFRNINIDDLTPTLTILIAAVNGVSTGDLGMRIDAGDLEAREMARIAEFQRQQQEQAGIAEERRIQLTQEWQRQQQERQQEAQRRHEQEQARIDAERQRQQQEAQRRQEEQARIAAERQQQQHERQQRAAARQRERDALRYVFFIGYNHVYDMPVGFTLGLLSWYGAFNFGFSGRGDGEINRFEWLIGYSIPLSIHFRVPIGIGFNHRMAFDDSGVSSGDVDGFGEDEFSIEAGLKFVLGVRGEGLFISATYRIRRLNLFGANGNALALGVGFIGR
ncbi:MAG: hypothetical protein FWG66_11620, partial [Spirochaetes bacterium]|nr:hypothetical protein [Spirochaetota bacterium]